MNAKQLEKERLSELKQYQILDTTPEQAFDEITQLASIICNKPISVISLLDKERQWFKSTVGLEETIKETPREIAFCNYTIKHIDQLTEVRNARKDERFYKNPLVLSRPGVRFYAGVPLVTKNGHALGALCVLDNKPSRLTSKQKEALTILAKKAMRILELRKNAIKNHNRLSESQQVAGLGSWDWDVETNELYWTEELYRLYGLNPETDSISFEKFASLIHPNDKDQVMAIINKCVEKHEPYEIEHRIIQPNGNIRWTYGKGSARVLPSGKLVRMTGVAMDITERKLQEMQRKKYVGDLETMLFSVSHELRKPITTLLGIANLGDLNSLAANDLEKTMHYIKESATEMDDYTKKMTNYLHNHKMSLSLKA